MNAQERKSQLVKASRHLPLEILSDIISRLPLEDFIRCSAVSSHWYQSTKHLPSNHLHCTKSQIFDILLSESTWVMDVHIHNSLHMISSNSSRRSDGKSKHIEIGHENNLHGYIVDSSCNGLLCLSDSPGGAPCSIYSPITKQVIMLPVLEGRIACKCSLGYDPTTNKYKVLVTTFERPDVYIVKITGYIITVGESSWRRLQFPEVIKGDIDRDPIFFNGAFHFVNGRQQHSVKDTYRLDGILTLDSNTEKFQVIQFSTSIDIDTAYARVFNIGNSLALVGRKSNGDFWSCYREKNFEPSIQIWKILGTNADGSCHYQYKKLNVAGNTNRLFNREPYLTPIGALGNGNLLFHARDYDPDGKLITNHLVLYDTVKDGGSVLKVPSEVPKVFNAIVFQPSLVSL